MEALKTNAVYWCCVYKKQNKTNKIILPPLLQKVERLYSNHGQTSTPTTLKILEAGKIAHFKQQSRSALHMWEVTLPDEFMHSVLTLISRTKSSLTSLLHLYTIGHCHYPQKSCWEWAWEGRWERCRKGIRMNSLFYTVHTCFSTVTSRILHPVAKQNNRSVCSPWWMLVLTLISL